MTILIRAESLTESMSDYLVREIAAAPNIYMRDFTPVVDAGGAGRLKWLELADRRNGTTHTVPAGAVFVLVGARPNADWLRDVVARADGATS